MDTCSESCVVTGGSSVEVAARMALPLGWVAASLFGDMEVLEKDWANEMLVLLGTFIGLD